MRHAAMFAALAMLTFAPPILAQATHVTNADYAFCLTLEKFNAQSQILASGDRAAWTRFMTNPLNGCAITRAGVRVYTANAKGLGVIRIRIEGETTWLYTYSEAVRRLR